MNANEIQLLIQTYNHIYLKLWERIFSTLGENSTIILYKTAIKEASRTYPYLSTLSFTTIDAFADDLKNYCSSDTIQNLEEVLLTIFDSIISLLTDLTGNIIVRKLSDIIDQVELLHNEVNSRNVKLSLF